MGTPVPPEFAELIDDKFYCCTMHQYGEGGHTATDCTDPFDKLIRCPHSGAEIKWWLSEGHECGPYWNLCKDIGNYAQKLICVMGPYDTIEECQAECPRF